MKPTPANILVIDTATEACSVAIQTQEKVYSAFEVCPQQHSQRILPMVQALCDEANIKIQDVDAIGFGRGPGSFTGVRIAIGTVQGLALGLDVPVIGVSTLEAMAHEVAVANSMPGEVLVAIDARMNEVYFAHFRVHKSDTIWVELVGDESVISPEDAAEYTKTVQSPVFAGTGWQAYQPLQRFINASEPSVLLPSAKYMLDTVVTKLANGLVDDAETAAPVYVRDTVTWKKLPGRE